MPINNIVGERKLGMGRGWGEEGGDKNTRGREERGVEWRVSSLSAVPEAPPAVGTLVSSSRLITEAVAATSPTPTTQGEPLIRLYIFIQPLSTTLRLSRISSKLLRRKLDQKV